MVKDTETFNYLREKNVPMIPATFFDKEENGKIELFPIDKVAELIKNRSR